MPSLPDHVFCLRGPDTQPAWKAVVNGSVVATEWPDRGSALAGMATEQRRAAIAALKRET